MTEYDPQAQRRVPADPVTTAAQITAEDEDVVRSVRGLAGLVADVDELDDVLGQIAHFALAAVPGAEGAGVTLMREATAAAPAVLAWAVTDPFVREIDHLQYEVLREGPCLLAMETRRAVVSGSLGSDRRWPRFGGRVARLDVHSALSLPLLARTSVVGALNIYAHERDVFTERAIALADRFARPAGVAVGNIQVLHAARTRAMNLQAALASRAVIDQAIGIVRSRSGSSEREAFDRLRQISQAENVKLAQIASRIVDEAVRRAHARHSSSSSD